MRERIYGLMSVMVVLLLAGCVGIKPDQAPSAQFTVPLTLEETYKRAMAQTQYCLVTEDDFPTAGGIAADGQSAQISVLLDFRSSVVAQVDMQSLSPQSTRVEVTMWNVNIWNQTAADAMQAAIEFGVPSCVNYFPSAQPVKKKR